MGEQAHSDSSAELPNTPPNSPIGPVPEYKTPASPKAAAGGSDNEAVPEAEQAHSDSSAELPNTPPNSPAAEVRSDSWELTTAPPLAVGRGANRKSDVWRRLSSYLL